MENEILDKIEEAYEDLVYTQNCKKKILDTEGNVVWVVSSWSPTDEQFEFSCVDSEGNENRGYLWNDNTQKWEDEREVIKNCITDALTTAIELMREGEIVA